MKKKWWHRKLHVYLQWMNIYERKDLCCTLFSMPLACWITHTNKNKVLFATMSHNFIGEN